MVFGNLSTGYWLGAAAAAGLHWVELGRKTLTGTGDTINVTGANADTTYTGDMSTGWTTSNAGSGFTLDGTDDEIDFLNNYSNDNVAIDLNSLVSGSISTSKWVLRFAIEMSGTASGDNIIWWNGVSSDDSVQANSTAQSFIGIGNQTINGTTGTRTYLAMCNDGRLDQSTAQVRLQSGGSDVSDFTGKHYFEIIRDGSNFTVNQYSDSYSTLYGSKTNAVSNEGGGTLRYFISANYQQGSNVTGTLSELKFYNGITSVAGDLTAKPYMMVLQHGIPSGNISSRLRFNSDTGSNYAQRGSRNGASDSTGTSRDNVSFSLNPGNASDEFLTAMIMNKADQEKLWVSHGIDTTAGASNDPNRSELSCKWANTSDSITSVNVYHSESGDYASGSECVVLGYDPDDTEGTSVWEELKSVSLSSGADTLDTGSFTSKKYLWIQAFIPEGAAHHGYIYFNNDTGANYARRGSINAGSDITTAPDNEINWSHATNSAKYLNMFVINKSDKEKLCIAEYMDYNSAGAGNAPNRIEWVYKWANTSAQISSVKLYNQENSSTDFPSGTLLKVWGFD